MRNLAGSLRLGASALFLLLGVLFILGLVLQLVGSWESVPGDAVWGVAGLAYAAAVVSRQNSRPDSRAELVCRVAMGLFGLSVAFVMTYWILVDSGQIIRVPPFYLALPMSLAAIGIAAWLVSVRTAHPK